MYDREDEATLYSQVNSMAAYTSIIKFALEKLEVIIDDVGDEVFNLAIVSDPVEPCGCKEQEPSPTRWCPAD